LFEDTLLTRLNNGTDIALNAKAFRQSLDFVKLKKHETGRGKKTRQSYQQQAALEDVIDPTILSKDLQKKKSKPRNSRN
jgi:hypothetical protein